MAGEVVEEHLAVDQPVAAVLDTPATDLLDHLAEVVATVQFVCIDQAVADDRGGHAVAAVRWKRAGEQRVVPIPEEVARQGVLGVVQSRPRERQSPVVIPGLPRQVRAAEDR